jgi:hypothetical protein
MLPGSSAFVNIPPGERPPSQRAAPTRPDRAENLASQAVCPGGCVNGCCSVGGVCACSSGWAGPACDVRVATCPGDTNATIPGMLGQYFFDQTLKSAPLVTRNDSEISFQWGYNGPAPGLPYDGSA